jgi:hypothetical protein
MKIHFYGIKMWQSFVGLNINISTKISKSAINKLRKKKISIKINQTQQTIGGLALPK